MPGIIDVSQLVKTYGDGTKAVKGITFSVNEGEFFGFLGPNGAGKSTTIKILTTLLQKTSGSASVAGLNVDSDAAKIRKIIGVQNQDTVVDEDLTGRENLVLQGQLQQMHGPAIKERVDDLGEIVAQGTPGDLKQEIGADSISLGFENSSMNGGDTKIKARQVLEQKFDGVSNVVDSDVGLTVYAKNGSYMVPELVRAFDEAHIRLSTIGVSSPTLDDVFLKHTGKRIRVEEVSSANARGMFGRRRR